MTYRENAMPDPEPTLCTRCVYGLNHEGKPLNASDEPDYAECCSPANGTNPVTGNARLKYCRKKNNGACPDFRPRQIRKKKSKKRSVAPEPSRTSLLEHFGFLLLCLGLGVCIGLSVATRSSVLALVSIVGVVLVFALGAWRLR